MTTGMIGRKLGMMRLYDGGGRVRAVTVIELGPNFVTQVRTQDRDGYEAVQLGFPGRKKRLNRPGRGHLRAANLEGRALTQLKEWRIEDGGEFTLGQELRADRFEPGTFVDLTSRSKGRGFQGGVRRHHFAGGPKTHGQSDRHRAPGSIGSGTTPGRVYKGLKMAGHMGDVTRTVQNLLVVAADAERNLLFVEGSAPGGRNGVVYVRTARRPALKQFTPPTLPADTTVAIEATEAEPVEAEATEAEATALEATAAEPEVTEGVTEESEA